MSAFLEFISEEDEERSSPLLDSSLRRSKIYAFSVSFDNGDLVDIRQISRFFKNFIFLIIIICLYLQINIYRWFRTQAKVIFNYIIQLLFLLIELFF